MRLGRRGRQVSLLNLGSHLSRDLRAIKPIERADKSSSRISTRGSLSATPAISHGMVRRSRRLAVISIPGTADKIFDQALAAHDRIDILVNNAGRSWGVTTNAITPDLTSSLMELNFNSVLWLSKRFIDHARKRGDGGSIVQISSTAGIAGYLRRRLLCEQVRRRGLDEGSGARSCARQYSR